MEFVETSTFTRFLPTYLDDEGYRFLQNYIVENPQAGKVISGTGGIRKLRWQGQRRGKGKHGGLRVIYYYLMEGDQVWLITLYDKDEADDLGAAEKKAYRRLVREIKNAWATGRKVH